MTTANKPTELRHERGGEIRTDSADVPTSARARSWREPMQIDDTELRTDSGEPSYATGVDFERRFPNAAHEARARRLAQQWTPLGEKPDADTMFRARQQVAADLDLNREGVAALRGVSASIESYVEKKGNGQ